MTIATTTVPADVSAKLDARQAQFTRYDYGREGDTRPYQVVMPSYPAPKFLQTFVNLRDGLRECGTLCRLHGKPFRLVKWGSKVPCVPCGQQKTNRLPSYTMRSRGALEGYPEATPIAEAHPTKGVSVFGPHGGEMLVGTPNYIASRTPFPISPSPDSPINQNYLQAVQTAQYLTGRSGARTYVCAGFGSECSKSKSFVPVVYVDPGALVVRYPQGLPLSNSQATSIPGSAVITTPVSPDAFKQLLAASEGRSLLAWNA